MFESHISNTMAQEHIQCQLNDVVSAFLQGSCHYGPLVRSRHLIPRWTVPFCDSKTYTLSISLCYAVPFSGEGMIDH